MLASATGLCAVILVGAAPRNPGEIAAVFPPWWPAERALDAAGTAGAVIRIGGLGDIIVTRGDPTTLAGQLRKAGALLLLDPVGAGLCAAPKANR